ncbi:MAG TPA: OmpH family outer membrane protein [Kiritimatiellia bacterium]|nr:OmpH family outer membrane protein [Kiritimatiellia bacterium]HPC49037.1 OmpH family outer membrane protein [Kiritimatiellia bacterium]HPK37565.1 OmpH family outer membrane protein [Kiritimatiellia bacterium]
MKQMSGILAAVFAVTMAMAQGGTAVVNMVDLVRFHPSRERDRKLMQDTEKEFQSKLDKQRDRFEQLRDDYEKAVKEARNPALNDKARAEAEDKAMKHRDVLAEADRDLRQEMQKLQRDLGDLDTRLLRQVTSDIREVLSKFAQEKKYLVVLDGTTIAYFDPKLDVTDEVLKRMGVDPKVRQEAKEKAEKEKAAAEKTK